MDNIKMYIQFKSILVTDMTQIVEILPRVTQLNSQLQMLSYDINEQTYNYNGNLKPWLVYLTPLTYNVYNQSIDSIWWNNMLVDMPCTPGKWAPPGGK